MNNQILNWISCLNIIGEELISFYNSTYVWLEFQDLLYINNELKIDNKYIQWLIQSYYQRSLLCIRRLTDHDNRSNSIWTILNDIIKYPKAITKEFYLSKCSDDNVESAKIKFETYAGGKYDYITEENIQKDIDKVENCKIKIYDYTTKKLAHCDKKKDNVVPPNLYLIHDIQDVLDYTAYKYLALLTHDYKSNTFADRADYSTDWKEIFKSAWLKHDT